MDNKPDISLFFPVYNDERTVRRVSEKALAVLAEVANRYEVIIVDDGSPDRAGAIADELAAEYPAISVVHHPKNLGYGAAVKTGLATARYDWICFTDGDDEYDVFDLRKLIALKDFYDLIITFRYAKVYSSQRQVISWVYNSVLRMLFRSPYRDISTGLRLIRKSLADQLALQANSPFIGAELTIKSMLKGYRIGEVGIQTFPREFGKGASVSTGNIVATIKDMGDVYRTIFSNSYDLPPNRTRN
jgi:glycosyltransferase involved in cell wall biosynthesis